MYMEEKQQELCEKLEKVISVLPTLYEEGTLKTEVLKDMVAKTLSDGNFLTIQKTYLEYYNLPVRLSNNGILLSAIGYYPGSLEAIVKLMKANLELEEKEIIKTFSFDASEAYEVKPVGQGITTGEKLETVPNFVGLSVSYAEDWANNHNIGIDIQFVDNLSPYYNSNIANGMIANQSINNGVLINNVSNIILYVNTIQDNKPNEDDNQEEENTAEENENNDIDLPDIILPSEEE